MWFEGLLFCGGLATVTWIALQSREGAFRVKRPPRKKRPSTRTTVEITRAFKPLDLGEDPVQWPSARPWALAARLPKPVWPSETWADEQLGTAGGGDRFGRRNTAPEAPDRGFHAMAARHTARREPGGDA